MLRKPAPSQTGLEIVTLEELVPKDHLLRRIGAAEDLTLIHDPTPPLHCADNGRPAPDSTLMFKAQFLGYLVGIR
ncbi:putative transposase-related protein [Rhodovulum sp. PH10]|nr:putative transposase-related protein [Rhodovulum sp. PH10]